MTMAQQHEMASPKGVGGMNDIETEPSKAGIAGADTAHVSEPNEADPSSPAEEQNGHSISGSRAEPPDTASESRPMSASSSTSTLNRGGVRSTSSKFASLRATFEQKPGGKISASNSTKKRRNEKGGEKDLEYEAEIARLKDELGKEKELRIAFEEKTTTLEEEVDELNEALQSREELWRSENERQSMQMKSLAEDRLKAMANEARVQQEEASNLQKQLADLKRDVSASTRSNPQVSDTTFRQEIGILQHEVQNWVVNNFRRVKIEASGEELCEKLEKVVEKKQLDCLRPVYKDFESAEKLPIYQATVACYLMEVFEEPYLYGLQGQLDVGKRLRKVAESLNSTFDAETYHRWRSMTFDALRQSESIKSPVENAAGGLSEMICITLESVTNAEESETRLPSLKAIIQRAISLAHTIRVQQAPYEFILPSPGEAFESSTMEDISDATEVEGERPIRCSTFPSLVKTGDEKGVELAPRNIVVKAKVLCIDNEVEP